jgi:exodeoxyribonuclease V beta subunit
MSTLDLYRLKLNGIQLVEASAGTGKTWTIAGLYLRLLLESGRDVTQILVVTFTRAATAELRDRLRARIVQVEEALAAGASDDDFCRWVLATFTEDARTDAHRRLGEARRRFDEAAIFTIHGFCQRVLAETQMPALLVEPDIVPDERELLPMLVQEAWIRHCNDVALADLLQESGVTLAMVTDDVRALLRKPYLILHSGSEADALEKQRTAKNTLRELWQQQGEAIRDDLRRADGLSKDAKKGYKDVDVFLEELQCWLESGTADMGKVGMLTPAHFQASSGKNKSGAKPQHVFWKQLEAVLAASAVACQQFRATLIGDVRAGLQRHKEQQGLLTYQDLLGLLAEAVADDGVAGLIRARYSAALIDEFQDTDPLQFRIFDRVYHTAPEAEAAEALPLFLVGDPKQAIYSFRGADIFTYLRARERAVERHTLDTNRRSLEPLVQAVNCVFAHNSNAFLFSDLRFQAVQALPTAPQAVFADGRKALHCKLLPAAGKSLSKEKACDLAAQDAAEDIVALLRDGAAGKVQIPDEHAPGGRRALAAPDIAVLVPSHRLGRLMADELNARGVAVVQRSEESVFATDEAAELHLVLEAVLAPGREGFVKAALLSTLLGWTVEQLHAAQSDDYAWGDLCERLLLLRERWQQKGFIAMWESLLAEFSVFDRLLRLRHGERRLTNLRHLATLLQQEADGEPVPERQLAWLREQLQDTVPGEDSQLRLESDAERVQILTVHVSKGLEYPVVFCPFLAQGRKAKAEDRAEYRSGAESLLDIGSSAFDHAHDRMTTERLAEGLRVLYVALTRAKYRCAITWGLCNDSEMAALSWLLLGQGLRPEPEEISAQLKGCTRDDYIAALEKIRATCGDGFSWEEMGEAGHTVLASAAAPDFVPQVPAYHRSLQRRWRVSSFTGLSESAHEHEAPDHDQQGAQAVLLDVVPQGIHGFPRGARAGVFWHELLEHSVMGRVPDRARFVADTLKKFALDESWQGLVEKMLARWLETPLGDEGLVLGALQARRAEMEFVYPVTALRPHSFLALPDVPPLYREALQQLDFRALDGYLKGFIDLIARHDGRYYVIDYKTNWLGPEDSAYTVAALERSVAEAHYYLQYWLYVLALHRHLRAALKDNYDYERDIGGVRYLYLRGLDAPTQGVYARRPSRALIEALDRLMEGAA